MAKMKFHFVDDYRALVRDLIARYQLPEAMSRAVGRSYDALGEIEKQLLIGHGLPRCIRCSTSVAALVAWQRR